MPPVYVPKNRAATEHRGALDRVIHSDPAQPFCILALTDGAVVKGDADADQFTRGTIYRFLGRWRDNDKKGPQFHFDGYVVHAAQTRAGIVKYLSEASDQLAPKIITRIWEKFREDSVSILRTDPARVATECNLSPDLCELASVDLQRGARFEDVKIELFQLFQGRGFHGKLIDAAITKWGLRAPAVIRKNPFNLLSMPSAGFRGATGSGPISTFRKTRSSGPRSSRHTS
jgi:hypothetical protein